MLTISSILYQISKWISTKTKRFYFLFRVLPFFTLRPNRNSMNFLAHAIIDYPQENKNSSLLMHQHCLQKKYDDYIRLQNSDQKKYTPDLSLYYRTYDKMEPIERELIELAYGNILDIGSCTGYYIPYLAKKGTVMGIDISDQIIAYAYKRGIRNCFVGDMFSYKFNITFDTITLIGNDIALTGTLYNLKRLLKRLYGVLNSGGQVLALVRHISLLKHWQVVYIPEYKGKVGPPLKCLFVNINFLMKLSRKYGFTPEIISSNNDKNFLFYLIRLVKK